MRYPVLVAAIRPFPVERHARRVCRRDVNQQPFFLLAPGDDILDRAEPVREDRAVELRSRPREQPWPARSLLSYKQQGALSRKGSHLAGQAAPVSCKAKAIACSNVIAFPSAHAAANASSPMAAPAAATARS